MQTIDQKNNTTTTTRNTPTNNPENYPFDQDLKKMCPFKYDHKWQYEDNGWNDYDPEASDKLEETYQSYLKDRGETDVRRVSSGEWEYEVDFMANTQMNVKHANHKVRNIKRVKSQ
eukprot:TRINITY_DN8495_c0_g2_i2.p2 TRINITY_DN8495_c0_g2~~TRINITY_DN8495_c0_g2_i2.p2  ORF type:complete len:116 (+),score=23.29 TRINITY_DN8495_c0_g2_i2:456-803(+)